MHNNKSKDFHHELQQLAEFGKTLSHPARVAIIRVLAEKKEIKAGNISDFLPLSRPTVSRHLKELKNAGIIDGTIEGLEIHYCLNMKKLTLIRKSLNDFFDQSISSFMCNC